MQGDLDYVRVTHLNIDKKYRICQVFSFLAVLKFTNQQSAAERGPRPLPGAILIPPALLLVADLPMILPHITPFSPALTIETTKCIAQVFVKNSDKNKYQKSILWLILQSER